MRKRMRKENKERLEIQKARRICNLFGEFGRFITFTNWKISKYLHE
jgi:hypothetical protein